MIKNIPATNPSPTLRLRKNPRLFLRRFILLSLLFHMGAALILSLSLPRHKKGEEKIIHEIELISAEKKEPVSTTKKMEPISPAKKIQRQARLKPRRRKIKRAKNIISKEIKTAPQNPPSVRENHPKASNPLESIRKAQEALSQLVPGFEESLGDIAQAPGGGGTPGWLRIGCNNSCCIISRADYLRLQTLKRGSARGHTPSGEECVVHAPVKICENL